jgi:DtxR family manganese transport transcriptional regulator
VAGGKGRHKATRSGRPPTSRRRPQRPRKNPELDPSIARQAAGHSKIRRDHSAEIAEDYVEMIAQLITTRGEARTVDIARRLGVSHVTVTKTLSRLQKEGLVRSEPYRSIFLTTAGTELAQRSAGRHSLVVQFLRMLGVDAASAEADAEGIEHHISEATLSAIRRFVAAG